ncbi:MAG: GNAT family N-acetyltransferase [Suilimivivens sp.]
MKTIDQSLLKFERAGEKDKREILALYHSLVGTECCAWTESYPGETDFEGDLSRNALFCLRNGDGEIVGVISVDLDEAVEKLPCWSGELQPSAELSRLGVKPEYQNQGIARLLLQYGMEELRRQGKKSVHFLVCKTNRKAIRSYDKLYFDVVGSCRMYGEEWWCYEKGL